MHIAEDSVVQAQHVRSPGGGRVFGVGKLAIVFPCSPQYNHYQGPCNVGT